MTFVAASFLVAMSLIMALVVWQTGEALHNLDDSDYCLYGEERFSIVTHNTSTYNIFSSTTTPACAMRAYAGDYNSPKGQTITVDNSTIASSTWVDVKNPAFLEGGIQRLFNQWGLLYGFITFIIGIVVLVRYIYGDG